MKTTVRISASVIIAVSLFSLPSCTRNVQTVVKVPRTVLVAKVDQGDFQIEEEAAAKIVPAIEVNLTPKVGGRVSVVRAEVGQLVHKDESLMELDASDYDAQYRQASASLKSAKASLKRTSESGQEQQVIQAQEGADRAKIAYDEAKSLNEKTKRLYDSKIVSKQQADDAAANFRNAEIQLNTAKKTLSLVKNKSGAQASKIASGQVDAASAQADYAKSQLESTVVRSPIDGLVSYRGVETGELVGTSTLAFVVIDDTSVIAQSGLSERQVGFVVRGMSIPVIVPALGDRSFEGTVDSIGPSPDPLGQLYALRVRIANVDGPIKGGMLARLRLPHGSRKSAILAPERAVFSENGGDYAFAAVKWTDGTSKIEKRELHLGESDGDKVEILSGLAPGDLVVIAGKELIGEGDSVNPSLQ